MSELKEAIELLEKEKGISRESLLESIEQSLMQACKSNFGKNDNINVKIDPVTCEYSVTAEKEVVATEADIVDPTLQVTVAEARKTDPDAEEGDIITVTGKYTCEMLPGEIFYNYVKADSVQL